MKILIGVLFFFFNYIKMWQLKFDNIFFTKTLLFVYQVYVNRKNHFWCGKKCLFLLFSFAISLS